MICDTCGGRIAGEFGGCALWCSCDFVERRTFSRVRCPKGDCDLPPDHPGSHRGSCGCLDGCVVVGCPNV